MAIDFKNYDLTNPMGLLNLQPKQQFQVNPMQVQQAQNNFQMNPMEFQVDPMQVQQAQMKQAQEQQALMDRRQRSGSMMLALSDVLKGRDPSAGVMQRQKILQDSQEKRQEQEKDSQEKRQEQEKIKQFIGGDSGLQKMYDVFGKQGVQQVYLQRQKEQKEIEALRKEKESLTSAGLTDTEINLYLSAGMDVKDIFELRQNLDLDKPISQLDEEVKESKGIVSQGLKKFDEAFGLADTFQLAAAKTLGPISPFQIAPVTTQADSAKQVINERIREKFVSQYAGRPSVYLNTRIDALLPQSSYTTELEAKQKYQEIKRVLVEGVDEMKTKIESGIYTGKDLVEAQEQYKDIQSIVKDLEVGINALSGTNYDSIYLPNG